jgi:hypothetical protein
MDVAAWRSENGHGETMNRRENKGGVRTAFFKFVKHDKNSVPGAQCCLLAGKIELLLKMFAVEAADCFHTN